MHEHCFYDVLLQRQCNQDLGLGLCGARNSDGKLAIVVSEIKPGSSALGKIGMGDRIISVNGESLENLEYEAAIYKLRTAGKVVALRLTKCIPGREFGQYSPLFNSVKSCSANGLYHNSNQAATDQSQISLFTNEQENQTLNRKHFCTDQLSVSDDQRHAEFLDDAKKKLFKTVHLNRRDNAESLGVELVSRIFVQSVDEGSLGESSGLRTGDRLVSLNGINAAHLSLVDTANMLRRQETVVEVARESTPDLQHEQLPHVEMNRPIHENAYFSEPEYSTTLMNRKLIKRGKRRHKYRYRPRQLAENTNDVRFNSLRELHRDNLPMCRHCSAAQSLDEDVLQSSTSEENLAPLRTGSFSPNQNYSHFPPGFNAKHRQHPHHHPHHHSLSSMMPMERTHHAFCSYDMDAIGIPRNLSAELPDLSYEDSINSKETLTAPWTVPHRRIRPGAFVTGIPTAVTTPNNVLENSKQSRKILFRVDPNRGTGLSLIGGNLTGVFVSSVQPDSLADQAGIGEGDQIIKINGVDLIDWTKEEVALALIADDGPVVLELSHDPVTYTALLQSRDPCDSLFVRAYFTLWPTQPNGRIKTVPELSISEGDIFHVIDTFVDGVFGNWMASKVCPTQSSVGIIPNWQRAEEIVLAENRRMQKGSGRATTISLPTYERVIQISSYPYPRPVVLYGPLAALARRQLAHATQTDPQFGSGSIRFELPPVNAAATLCVSQNDDATTGLIRLSAIKRCMTEQNSHCLLDLNLNAVNRLLLLGIPPIVILISPVSRDQLRTVLEQYWDVDKTSLALLGLGNPRNPLRKRHEVKELADKLWREVMHLRHFKAHLITDTVPLIPATNGQAQRFSELDWLRNMIAVIKHQQNQPVWIGEESQLAQELLEKASNQNKIPVDKQVDKSPGKPQISKPTPKQSPSLAKKLERLGKLTSQLNLNEAPQGSEIPMNILQQRGERQIAINQTNHFVNNNGLSMHPAEVGSHKQADPDKLKWRNTTESKATPRGSSPTNLEETDISWTSDFPKEPTENSTLTPRRIRMQKEQLYDNEEMDHGISHDQSNIVSWDSPVASELYAIPRMPASYFLDAFGICVHATQDGVPVSMDQRSVVIEEVADAATLTSPRRFETRAQTTTAITTTTGGSNHPRCPSRSSTIDKTSTLDFEHHSTVSSVPFTSSKSILAECAGEFGQEGGALELPEHQVRLYIPPGALPTQPPRQRLFLRIYDSNPEWGPQSPTGIAKSRQRLISPLVMCGPRGLRFRVPVELTVPRYHWDSDSTSASEVSEASQNGTRMMNITLLHTSSFSTSTSADEADSSRKDPSQAANKSHYATWHEIPMVQKKEWPQTVDAESANGIKSCVQQSNIAISIDHF